MGLGSEVGSEGQAEHLPASKVPKSHGVMVSVGTQFPQFPSLDDVSKMTPVLFRRIDEGKQTHFDQR